MYFHNPITNFKKVKMTVDKDFTVVNKVAQVKEDWKDLQEQFSVSDMLGQYFEALEENGVDVGGIGTWDCVSCYVEGYNQWRETSFNFECILQQYSHRIAGAKFIFRVGDGVLKDPLLLEFDVYEMTRDKDGDREKKEAKEEESA